MWIIWWKNTTLDRIDVNGNYVKDNIRWATWEIQLKNKRWKEYIAIKDDKIIKGTAVELSKIIGCNSGEISSTANKRRNVSSVYGWKIEKVGENK